MRIVFILLASILLTGCPSFFTAIVNNESQSKIEVLRFVYSDSGEVILPNESVKVDWSRDCQIVAFGDNKKVFLHTLEFPEDTFIRIGNRETQLRVLYDGTSFFYLDSNGKKFPINEGSSC
ncbi:MAG: hypothetical protein OQK04_01770 [Kangiellaceae bacterium]|nr:hypothetical protein [Kangiellaceae bacterium]MCW8997431.1 hypothetical protein [Kangiellaceae bacterium]